MALVVHDSLAGEKRPFEPLVPGQVGIYVCGPTVYGHCHIGHAKSYVAFDVIVKWLRQHYTVRYIQNITDVGHLTDDADEGEDKIARQARFERVHPLELVDVYMRSYFADMEALGVAHPNIYVRATQHIPEQIELTAKLIETGHAYEVQGNVYFDVASWPDYGCLSGRRAEDQLEGARVGVRSDKRDPRDFALWKSAEGTGHILRWKSPWGEGYPGWHIECSAMSMKYLGETFDIHGGGNENKFPHHECEIAQSRAATGGGFARYWLHNNMINVEGQKMGKSLGNTVSIKEALAEFSPEALRLFLLSTHYRRPSDYTRHGMTTATGGVERLSEARRKLAAAKEGAAAEGPADADLTAAAESSRAAVAAAMDDDFNTPLAIAALFDLAKAVNVILPRGVGARAVVAAETVFDTYGRDVLGVVPDLTAAGASSGELEAPLIETLLEVRAALRAARHFELADMVRDRLAALGITIKDAANGATWSRS